MKSIAAFLGVFVLAVFIGYLVLDQPTSLKVFKPSDIDPQLVDESLKGSRKQHRIADFSLINQFGDTVTKEDFEGSIYVADFFFTRCPTICPIMTSNFAKTQEHFKDEKRLKFLSHSVTPIIDSVSVLYNYSIEYGAIPGRWHLVTGDKKHIYDLARKSYFAVLDEGDGGMQDFIHTENMILVDTEGRIRGYYNGVEDEDIERMHEEIELLLEEEFTS